MGMGRKLFVTGISFKAQKKADHRNINKIQYLKDAIPKIVEEAEASLGKDVTVMMVLPEYELTKEAVSNEKKKEYLKQLQEILKNYKNVILVPGSFSTYNYYRKYVEDYAKLKKILENYENLAKNPAYNRDEQFKKHHQDFKDFVKKVEEEFQKGNFPSIDYVVLKNQSYILLPNTNSDFKYKKSFPFKENQALRDQNQLSFYKIGVDSPIKKVPVPNSEGELNIGITICYDHNIITDQNTYVKGTTEGQNTHIQIIPSDSVSVKRENLFGAVNIHIDTIHGLSVLVDDAHPASSDFKEIQAKHYQISKHHLGMFEEEISVPIKHFYKPFYTAVKLGDVEKVKELIKFELDKDLKSDLNRLLHSAVINKHHEVVKLLLEHGANINSEKEKGVDSLTLATRNNDLVMVNLLLDEGANHNSSSALFEAIKKGNVNIVETLLKKNANVKDPLESGETPLHIAVKFKQYKIAELLLNYEADIISLESEPGIDALALATRNNDLYMVNLLLDYGADHNSSYALFEAIQNGNIDIVKTFLEKDFTSIDLPLETGETPLHFAVKYQQHEIVDLLLNYGANINLETASGTGIDALTLATRNKDLAMVNLLLTYGALPNYTLLESINVDPNYTLVESIKNGYIYTAQLSLNNGADVNLEIEPGTGIDAITHATMNNDLTMVNLLLTNGARPNSTLVEAISANPDYTLFEAIKNGYFEIAELSLNNGANINLEIDTGIDALSFAIRNNDIAMVNLLLEKAANPNSNYALCQAILYGNLDIVETLVKNETTNLVDGPCYDDAGWIEFSRLYDDDDGRYYIENKISTFLLQKLQDGVVNSLDEKIPISPIEMAELMGHTEIKGLINKAIKDKEKASEKIFTKANEIVNKIDFHIQTKKLSENELNDWKKLKIAVTNPANGDKTFSQVLIELKNNIRNIKPVNDSSFYKKSDTESNKLFKDLIYMYEYEKLNPTRQVAGIKLK